MSWLLTTSWFLTVGTAGGGATKATPAADGAGVLAARDGRFGEAGELEVGDEQVEAQVPPALPAQASGMDCRGLRRPAFALVRYRPVLNEPGIGINCAVRWPPLAEARCEVQ
jgi:hypothetical protein